MSAEFGINGYGANEAHIAMRDRLYVPDGTTPGILWWHGRTAVTYPSALLTYDFTDLGAIPQRIIENWPLMAADFAGNAWGNPLSHTRGDTAVTYMEDAPSVNAKTNERFVIGGSMGTIPACKHTLDNAAEVLGLALMLGPVGLANAHANPTYTTEVENAWGGLAALTAALPTNDPLQLADELAATNVPIEIWACPIDPVVDFGDVLDFADIVGAVVHELSIGHTTHDLNPNEIVDFFKECEAA